MTYVFAISFHSQNQVTAGMLHEWFGQDCSLASKKLGGFSQERLGAVQPNFTVALTTYE